MTAQRHLVWELTRFLGRVGARHRQAPCPVARRRTGLRAPAGGTSYEGPVKAGRSPENGASRLTIRTYRIRPDGETDGHPQQRTVISGHDTQRLPESHAWPPCACPRCRTGRETDLR